MSSTGERGLVDTLVASTDMAVICHHAVCYWVIQQRWDDCKIPHTISIVLEMNRSYWFGLVLEIHLSEPIMIILATYS